MPSQASLLEIIKLQTDIAKIGMDLHDVMELVVERALPLTGADGVVIELVEDDALVYRAASGIAKSHLGLRLNREDSLSGVCVETGAIMRCDDTERDPRVNRELCKRVGGRSMILVPLKYKEVTVGVLKALSQKPGQFGAAEMTLLGLLSELVGATLFFAAKYGRDDLFFSATHDSLTGLANRALFIDRLRSAIALGSRDKRPVGVLMIDMDDLKKINDTYGHRVGDAVLKEFANRSRAGARATDTVARLGGDEFGVLLKPVETPDGIETAIQRQYAKIEAPFLFEHRVYQLHASIGAASFPEDGYDVGGLLDAADRRMYETKRKHKCGTALYHAS